jgi:hypothetical protein
MGSFDFLDLSVRLVYDVLTAFLIVRVVYFRRERRREYLFTFIVFNLLIFFVCTFLKSILMDIGFAFGLFAVFSVLRYRTESIPIREMTYQFVVICLGALNGLADPGTWHPELLFLDLVTFGVIILLDGQFLAKEESFQRVKYDRIELIRPEKRAELVTDLKARTGLEITRLEIRRIDFLRDSADLLLYYRASGTPPRHLPASLEGMDAEGGRP